jgi:CMP-N-acetylneuraminic acid synthetase
VTQSRGAWTAIIPLRGGSKGLPGKNIRLLAGKPLYRHAVDQALAAGASKVLLTTDIEEVLCSDLPADVQAFRRPAELCLDTTPMAPVLAHAIAQTPMQGPAVLLQPTSPLRTPQDIRAALEVFVSGAHELVMSVTEADRGVLKWGTLDGDRFRAVADPAYCFSNRQALPPVFRPNGAIYVVDAAWFSQRRSFVTDRIGVIVMPAARSRDIDTLADFAECEALLARTTRTEGT